MQIGNWRQMECLANVQPFILVESDGVHWQPCKWRQITSFWSNQPSITRLSVWHIQIISWIACVFCTRVPFHNIDLI